VGRVSQISRQTSGIARSLCQIIAMGAFRCFPEKLCDFLSQKSLGYPFDLLVLCHAAGLAHGDGAQLRVRLTGVLEELKSQGHIRL